MNYKSSALPPVILILMSTVGHVASRFAFADGRQVVLNPTLLTWDEAVTACNEMNGTLLTVFDAGTLIDIGIDGKWIVWVGLKIGADDKRNTLKWSSGDVVTWQNWDNPGSPAAGEESCSLVLTNRPYEWTAVNCDTRWPSLCEVHNGTCHFEVNQRRSVAGFNNDLLLNVGLDTCRRRCQSSAAFFCLSFEYNPPKRFCQLSATHRWNEPAQFGADFEWNYYHRQCYAAEVDETWIPNGEIRPVTEGPTTTQAITTPTLPDVLSTEPEPTDVICVKITPPTENKTEEIMKEVEELQALGEVYKEKRRTQSKESVSDPRPSARYLGTVALSITLSLLLAVVVLDLMTVTRHCSGRKAKHKQKVSFQRRSFKDFASGRVVRLNPTWPSSGNVSPAEDHYSCPADLEEVEIRLNDVDVRAGQADEENSDLKPLETSDDRKSNSYVSWPYDKTSPVLYPFHRSKSEKVDSQRRSPHSLRVTDAEKYPRSKSDSFYNKRIYVLPESNNSDWLVHRPGLTKTEQLVMAYGHHFDGDDSTTTSFRSLKVEKLRPGSHC